MRRVLACLFLLIPLIVAAQEVDRSELEELGDADLDFLNYEGPHEYIDTIEEIRGIGGFLGREITREFGRYSYAGRYTLIHVFDPETTGGLDADIMILESGAGVDHIVNLRRIISGYVEAAYEYSREDSDLLAKYVTIYNAVVRGDMPFFEERYKSAVLDYLTAEAVGLSLDYRQWAGASQIVIPLMSEAGPGELDSIDFRELIDERVIDRLREEEQMGLEDRRAMVELIDRVVEERETEIREERQALEDTPADEPADEPTDTGTDEPGTSEGAEPTPDDTVGPDDTPPADEPPDEPDAADEPADEPADTDQPADTAQPDDDQPDGDQPSDTGSDTDEEPDETDLAEDEAALQELEDAARRERERIAQDTRLLLDEEDPTGATLGDMEPVLFVEVTERDGLVRGQLVQINPMTGAVLNRSSEDRIVTRDYELVAGRLLVVVEDGDVGRLALYDTNTLDQVGIGVESIYPGTALSVQGEDPFIYAVFSEEEQWYVGRFAADLSFVERSYLAVTPYTPMVFSDDSLWVQSRDGIVVPLSIGDLSVVDR